LQLKERAGAASLVLTVSHADDLSAAAAVLRRSGNEVFIESSARRITTAAGGLADLTTAAGWLDESGIAVDDLGLARPSLDDVFLSLTGRRTESDDNEQEPGQ
jgi:ABC-2 type transport system ATP-binding protein